MNNELLKQYSELELAFTALEDERTALRGKIVAEFIANKVEKEETAYGSFTLGRRSNYTYTDKIKLLEDKVKIAKHKEVEKGLATEKVTEYLVYKPHAGETETTA